MESDMERDVGVIAERARRQCLALCVPVKLVTNAIGAMLSLAKGGTNETVGDVADDVQVE